MPWRLREQGRERRGGGWAPPSYTRSVINPLDNSRIRAVLQWAIIREHELWTGETPWNNNRGNVMRENNTRVRVTPEIPPRADPLDRHKQELLNGVVEDKISSSWHSLLFCCISSLTFDFCAICKNSERDKVYTLKQVYSICWWHLKYWDEDLGLKVKMEEPLALTLLNIKVKSPPTQNLQYPLWSPTTPSSCYHSLDPNSFDNWGDLLLRRNESISFLFSSQSWASGIITSVSPFLWQAKQTNLGIW